MIIEEIATLKSGRRIIRRHSDQNVFLIQTPTGLMYSEPVDVENAPYTYSESNVPIPVKDIEEPQ